MQDKIWYKSKLRFIVGQMNMSGINQIIAVSLKPSALWKNDSNIKELQACPMLFFGMDTARELPGKMPVVVHTKKSVTGWGPRNIVRTGWNLK